MTAALRFDPIRLPPECEQLRKEVRAFLAEEIAAGTLDPPTGLRTVAHTYVADAGDYYTIADGLKTYPGTHLTAAVDK